jgi:hypothetical protein
MPPQVCGRVIGEALGVVTASFKLGQSGHPWLFLAVLAVGAGRRGTGGGRAWTFHGHPYLPVQRGADPARDPLSVRW